MFAQPINFSCSIGAAILITVTLLSHFIEAKQTRLSTLIPRCQEDECELSPSHFVLYSRLKQANESQFDVEGKELPDLIESWNILKARFQPDFNASTSTLNGTALIRSLLNDRYLVEALRLLDTSAGRQAVNVYGRSMSRKKRGLVCSRQGVEDLRYVTQDSALNYILAKVHKRTLKKSAKKCLKYWCSSLDVSMSKLDSILRFGQRETRFKEDAEDNQVDVDDSKEARNQTSQPVNSSKRREFESEEIELCRFFKKTNETGDCILTGNDLSQVHLIEPCNDQSSDRTKCNITLSPLFADYLDSYYNNSVAYHDIDKERSNQESSGRLRAARVISSQCNPLSRMLDNHLAGFRWLLNERAIEDQQLTTRLLLCPSFSYWYQVDRLCNELTVALSRWDQDDYKYPGVTYEIVSRENQ